jgi:hypothetical protein
MQALVRERVLLGWARLGKTSEKMSLARDEGFVPEFQNSEGTII